MKKTRQKILDLNTGFFDLIDLNFSEWPSSYISQDIFSIKLKKIFLPDWAKGIGIGQNNEILVPQHCIKKDFQSYENVDWWRAAFDMLTMKFEYEHEKKYGVIHSYSNKLFDVQSELYDRAWCNRIFLFLRKWTALTLNKREDEIFFPIPKPVIYLTHDVDYINKTVALRLKFTVFELFNMIKKRRYLSYLDFKEILKRLVKYNFSFNNYLNYQEIFLLENQINAKSYWNFYSRRKRIKTSFVEWLIDPSYKLETKEVIEFLNFLKEKRLEIGLHQGFYSWKNIQNMTQEKNNLQLITKKEIVSCRQHWLRFSLADTWRVQESLGIKLDMTLGFNNRIGFRNSAALKIPAWLSQEEKWSQSLTTVPMILMDSHLYDYNDFDETQRRKKIDDLLDEILFTGGHASIIWHTHVFSEDYGWKDDYEYLLKAIKQRGILTND
jgi:hypothetical protein